MNMDIDERIDKYLEENELNEETEELDEELVDLIESFVYLDESRKSQFVAKLIGLGVLVKGEDGSLQPGKEMSTEKVLKKLRRRGKINKIKRSLKSLF